MARKNKNAGQPNRAAQMTRHAERRYRNERFKYRKSDDSRVLGPGSDNLTFVSRSYGELIIRETYVVREKVSA